MALDLRERCAIVTGGAHGIGRALAERLAREGARVVVADLNRPRAEKVAQRIGGLAVECDVSDRASVGRLVARAVEAFGPVRVFCSNAGFSDHTPGLDLPETDVRAVVDVNLLAHVWAAQEVVPAMVDAGEGYMVQTISSVALITGPSFMAYTLSKHGALGFAEWLAVNYADLGVRVSCICPNAVNTGMLGRDEDDEATPGRPEDPVVQSLGDVVEPELCADMALAAMAEGRFLVLPHPRVGESFLRKATDYDRWLEGTSRRLQRMRAD